MASDDVSPADPADSAEPPIRVAVVGAGWVSREVWVPMLDEHEQLQVTAVVDTDAEAAARAVRGTDHGQAFQRLADLSPDVADAAVVALPNHLHRDTAQTLMRQGLPVFVEKPVSRSLEEAQDLAEISHDDHQGGAQARLLSWSAARHRADVGYLRGLLPLLGDLRAMDLSWTRAAGIPQRTGWFTDRRLAGGGALLDLGWHLLDVGLELLGWPAIEQVAGTQRGDWMARPEAVADWRSRPGAAVERPAQLVEDTVQAMLVTADGVAVRLQTRWASHAAADTTVISVEGSEGQVTLETTFGFSPHRSPARLTLLRRGTEQEIPLPDDPIGAEYRRQVDELAHVLQNPGHDDQHDRAENEVLAIADVIERIYAAAGPPLKGVRR